MIRTSVALAELHSDLVTRHTGRAVRLTIESRLTAGGERPRLTILDFRDVQLIDFSCADEVVAKLLLSPASDPPRMRRFFLFRGMAEHHMDPVDSALRRRGLAAAAECLTGEPCLLGAVDPEHERIWIAVCRAGRAAACDVAGGTGLREDRARRILELLCARCLLLREGEAFLSLGLAAMEAGAHPAE